MTIIEVHLNNDYLKPIGKTNIGKTQNKFFSQIYT